MAYLRIRNGYGYVCKKVKNEGQWKEEMIVPLGRVTTENNKEKMEWIVKTGVEFDVSSVSYASGTRTMEDDFIEDMCDRGKEDKVKGKQLRSVYEWSYAPIEYMGKLNPDELKITHKMGEEDIEKIEAKLGYSGASIIVFIDEEGKKYYWGGEE